MGRCQEHNKELETLPCQRILGDTQNQGNSSDDREKVDRKDQKKQQLNIKYQLGDRGEVSEQAEPLIPQYLGR